jgi:hypothetical protein
VDGACTVGGRGGREEADLWESRIKFSSYFLRVEIQIYSLFVWLVAGADLF